MVSVLRLSMHRIPNVIESNAQCVGGILADSILELKVLEYAILINQTAR